MDPSSIEPMNLDSSDTDFDPEFKSPPSIETDGIEHSDDSKKGESTLTKSSRRRTAIIASVIIHVFIAIGLFAWYVPNHTEEASQQIADGQDFGDEDRSSRRPSFQPPPPEPADVGADEIQESIKSQIESASKLPEETQRSELAKNLRRLESIADQESVIETSKTIATALGIDSQKYANKEPTDKGPIDIKTAQLQNVVRTKDQSGKWKYEAIMVDAEGRKSTVPMSQSEGESVYQTFQTMNQFPMAKGIYQNVVMPMLQQMMEAEELAEKAERAARQIEAQESAMEPLVPDAANQYPSPEKPDGK